MLEREGGEGEDFSGWVLREEGGRQDYSTQSPNGLNEISGFRYCNWSLPSRQERTGLFWCVCVHASVCVHKSELSLYLQEKRESCSVTDEFHVQPAAKQAVLWNLPWLCPAFHSENIMPKGRGSGLDKIRLDLSICPELKPNACLPEFLAFDKAQIISLATCPSSSTSALYGSTWKN